MHAGADAGVTVLPVQELLTGTPESAPGAVSPPRLMTQHAYLMEPCKCSTLS